MESKEDNDYMFYKFARIILGLGTGMEPGQRISRRIISTFHRRLLLKPVNQL